jgi:phosphoglycolate phosphatase
MIGDNANDVHAARAAGVPVILRAGGYIRVPATELGADAVIETFAELPAALARVTGHALHPEN